MSASDLPDCNVYSSSLQMARTLVTYMDDADAIRRRIAEDFNDPPAHATIAILRKQYLAKHNEPKEPDVYKAHEGYYPSDAAGRADAANVRFVEALERERALSAERAKAQGALDSPALRQPAIVDRAWERETEMAWRQNTEMGG